MPAEDIPLEPSPKERSAALDSVWEALLRHLRNEKISVASYLAEGSPVSLKDRVAVISFPERLNFHKECLEVADNKKLIEKHVSRLLEQEIYVQFLTVKEAPGIAPVEEETAPPKASEEANAAIQSAMNILGGRLIR